jgi:hypothetical protein
LHHRDRRFALFPTLPNSLPPGHCRPQVLDFKTKHLPRAIEINLMDELTLRGITQWVVFFHRFFIYNLGIFDDFLVDFGGFWWLLVYLIGF